MQPTASEGDPSIVGEGTMPPSAIISRRKSNAQAQAEFRARRNAYITALEETIERLENILVYHQDLWRESQAEVLELQQENERLRSDLNLNLPWNQANSLLEADHSGTNIVPSLQPHAHLTPYPPSSFIAFGDPLLQAEMSAAGRMQCDFKTTTPASCDWTPYPLVCYNKPGDLSDMLHTPPEILVPTAHGGFTTNHGAWALPFLEPSISSVRDSPIIFPLPCRERLQGGAGSHHLPQCGTQQADSEISCRPESTVDKPIVVSETYLEDKRPRTQSPRRREFFPATPPSTIEVIRAQFFDPKRKRSRRVELRTGSKHARNLNTYDAQARPGRGEN
ncbi:hypothetical protein CVT26_004520 [Gymnopilus dilepis]|uniref:BZIP domain-containing protein n=1 Tax=Gymnopilus dilepis TaxID=231916 RepID=A0A409WF44_9AGAR|nr:hypothetical protein CVT26_004520 [Gymnopilus dilepis]